MAPSTIRALTLSPVHSTPGVPDETILELFYRLQLTDTLELTPMIQVLFNPALSDKEIVGVFGARLLMTF